MQKGKNYCAFPFGALRGKKGRIQRIYLLRIAEKREPVQRKWPWFPPRSAPTLGGKGPAGFLREGLGCKQERKKRVRRLYHGRVNKGGGRPEGNLGGGGRIAPTRKEEKGKKETTKLLLRKREREALEGEGKIPTPFPSFPSAFLHSKGGKIVSEKEEGGRNLTPPSLDGKREGQRSLVEGERGPRERKTPSTNNFLSFVKKGEGGRRM